MQSPSLAETRDMLTEIGRTFTGARADYNAARRGRFRRSRRGVSSTPNPADYHYWSESDFLYAMEVARDIDRNDLVVGQGIERLADNVVRDGFELDPETGDRALDADLKAAWDAWSESAASADAAGEHCFAAMERLAFRSSIVDGDMFAALKKDGRIDLIEAHRPRTPRDKDSAERPIVHGVELGPGRQRRRLWLTVDNLHPLKSTNKNTEFTSLPFFDADGERITCQVYRPRRVSQSRGFTALAPVVDPCGMHDDIQFALLVQRQIVSCFGFIRQQKPVIGMPPGGDTGAVLGEQSTETRADGTSRTIEGIAPGMQVPCGPDEVITAFSPNVPNPEFFPHAMMILTFIAINLGLPVQVLLLDPKNTNFSGWRGAIDQARLGFERLQKNLIARFHLPVYRWWLQHRMAEDASTRAAAERADVDIWSHVWQPPSWDYIEPGKDTAADLAQVRNSMTSQRRRCAKRGLGDWSNLAQEIVEDNEALIVRAYSRASELNAKHPGLNLNWRELAWLPTPDGVRVEMPMGAGGEAGGDDDDEGRDDGGEGRGTGGEE